MGKRFYFGVFLLILLLCLSLAANSITSEIYAPVEANLRSAAQEAMEQDWASALPHASQAKSRWLQYRLFTASIADQSPMDETDRLFAEMEVFARCRDKEHFAAVCSQLAVMCRAMGDAHSGAWWNLL